MKTVLLPLLLVVILSARTVDACININGVSIDGDYVSVMADEGEDPATHLRVRMMGHAEDGLSNLKRSATGAEADAVGDILSGRYAAAIEKLRALESEAPGNYSTAANLGTAYELAGDNKNALHWIAEGIKRNDTAHLGTEWLHKRILETKIALETNPELLKTTHILPVTDSRSRDANYFLEIDGRKLGASNLRMALRYQLGERMLFVKPADPVVADLLYSFAILEANTQILEPAVELLKLAKEYGYHDTADLDSRMARYQQIIDSTWKVKPGDIFSNVAGLIVWCVLLTPVFLLGRGAYRLWRQRSAGQPEA